MDLIWIPSTCYVLGMSAPPHPSLLSFAFYSEENEFHPLAHAQFFTLWLVARNIHIHTHESKSLKASISRKE